MRQVIAIAGASLGREGGSGFAALVARKDEIVVVVETRAEDCFDPTAHAELMAVSQAARKLRTRNLADCVLYTSCLPCAMCAAAIWWAQVGQVYYAAGEEDCLRSGFDPRVLDAYIAAPLETRSPPMQRLCGAAGTALFDDWRTRETNAMAEWTPPAGSASGALSGTPLAGVSRHPTSGV